MLGVGRPGNAICPPVCSSSRKCIMLTATSSATLLDAASRYAMPCCQMINGYRPSPLTVSSSLKAWRREAELGVMQQHQTRAMQAYRGAIGAALRWYALSRGLQRQRVIVDRAVRMYAHRVIASTQRAVLRGWSEVVEGIRDRRRATGVVFCQCLLITLRKSTLLRAFRAWVAACTASNKAAAALVAEELEQVCLILFDVR